MNDNLAEMRQENYPSEHRFFVYDINDNCVISDGFHFEDEAISYAIRNKHTAIKIHRYYRDPTRGFKLYPDGEPELTWVLRFVVTDEIKQMMNAYPDLWHTDFYRIIEQCNKQGMEPNNDLGIQWIKQCMSRKE